MIHVNEKEAITAPTHPFYVPKLGWTSAIKLRAGDILVLSNGEYVVVEAVQHEILESPVKVYNFEVEDFHTYFVGESSVLVHNMCAIDTESAEATTRVRHYTNNKGLKGIQTDGKIIAQDNGRVYMEPASKKALSPKVAEAKYQLKPGRAKNYVEFDVPNSRLEWVTNPRYHTKELTVKGDINVINPKYFWRR